MLKKCAGCDQEVEAEYKTCNMPLFSKFSHAEFYTFGRAQFCAACIEAIESADYDESEYQK
jgi:hypothetical protein